MEFNIIEVLRSICNTHPNIKSFNVNSSYDNTVIDTYPAVLFDTESVRLKTDDEWAEITFTLYGLDVNDLISDDTAPKNLIQYPMDVNEVKCYKKMYSYLQQIANRIDELYEDQMINFRIIGTRQFETVLEINDDKASGISLTITVITPIECHTVNWGDDTLSITN